MSVILLPAVTKEASKPADKPHLSEICPKYVLEYTKLPSTSTITSSESYKATGYISQR
jgi:hypothetical protein